MRLDREAPDARRSRRLCASFWTFSASEMQIFPGGWGCYSVVAEGMIR